ncbi:SUMF1/EgtB/PvdO family nonheme iron enzyme [Leucothrix pacifica]|uniref:TIR domain-containing protein n=1 Tax=Leucothrix pacifica TaxID=1247513 RepID=A0A317CF76_9GAMM|nr:SUMF1/EgtB/PvdO family nonheme iron enzyme [Leucothrix pacifica]PWQ96053.1 hypothetical protein DKW60_13450 [Leucothrix pacifica]
MSEIPPVFISYARDGACGQALARELYLRLNDEQIAAFIDEHAIRLGSRWIRRLSDGAEHCKVMLSVVSPASHDRPWVEREFIMAERVGALVIPVLASDGDLPFQMCDLQGINFYGEHKASNWPLLLSEIKSALGISEDIQQQKRQTELTYLHHLLQNNDERAVAFAGEVYAPLAVKHRKERKRIAAAAMSPRLRHRKQNRYDEPQELQGECTEHHDIIEAFKQHKRLVILGEPGAGKTFSLWRIAAEQATLALKDDTQPMPVVVPLNRWDDPEQTLQDFVLVQMEDLSGEFTSLHQAKRLMPLFDALNEIPFDQREAKLPQVRQWLKDYPCDTVLVTCRQRDYRGPLDLELNRLTIEPLDPPRVYDFLKKYFSGGEEQQALAEQLFWQLAGGDGIRHTWEAWKKQGYEAHWDDFWTLEEVPEDWKDEDGHNALSWLDSSRKTCLADPRSLMKLASNPYLLTQIVHIYSDQQQLPESRIALFGEFVEDLIYREIEARPENHYPKAHEETLQAELKQLAWQLQSRSGSLQEARTILPRADAEAIMPLERLEFSAAASLLELTIDNVRFSHQLLQEFFTAQSFEAHIAKGLEATALWSAENWWEANGWEEAAKLAAEYQADPSAFLHWLAAGNPRLAAEIARDQGYLPQKETLFADYRERWQTAITDVERYPHPHERHAISTVLAWLEWDNRAGIGLNEQGLPDIHWLEVPEGEFIYGEGDAQQTLHLDTFYVSQYPVTNAQFKVFVESGAYDDPQWWEGLEKEDEPPEHAWTESNRPVDSVNWYDAIAYCRWLSAQTGLDIQLPTEQHWEKMARGPEGLEYPWGKDYVSGNANINEGSKGKYCLRETSAVGMYARVHSPFQAMDTSGNVWEWCINKYDDSEVTTIDRSDDWRVVRGGAWNSDPEGCRSAFRYFWRPQSRGNFLGFRLLCFSSPMTDH